MGRGGLGFFRGALIGAGMVYWLDPLSGRRRRIVTRQRLSHTAEEARHQLAVALRDLSHRVAGLLARSRRRVQAAPVDDVTLKARVQARIGRATSHPSSLQIACRNGRVELAGVVLKHEMAGLVRAVHQVSGVDEVVNCLETRDQPAHMPPAQSGAGGDRTYVGHVLRHASPAMRLLAAMAGLALFARGRQRRGARGLLGEIAGVGLVGGTLSMHAFERFSTLEGTRRGIGLRKTINVDAPLEQVFALFSRAETFPLFMRHVHEVQRIDDRHTRWKIGGPARLGVEWNAELVEARPNELLAWRSAGGAAIEHAGRVRFTRNEDGGTRVEVQLSYHPPGGILGHLLATLLGASPKKLMDDDLVRLKSLLEQGKATGRFGTVTRDEIEKQGL